jgi:trk system potassium uptake protein TrkH
MLIGGGTCSTAGGIKQFRVYVLWRQFLWDIKRSLMPRTAVLERPIWEGSRRVFVDDARVRQVAVFVFLYLVTYVFGVMLLCACGFSLADALFEFASAIGTVGLVGVTPPGCQTRLCGRNLAMFLGDEFAWYRSLLKLGRDGR